jgi:hypothetical protein
VVRELIDELVDVRQRCAEDSDVALDVVDGAIVDLLRLHDRELAARR